MRADTSTYRFSKQTIRQVSSDARRSLARAHYCAERSNLERLQCVDYQPEEETSYGRQLWYFDAATVDELDRHVFVYGAIEYSIQYELHELVEDGVFDSIDQRKRFETVYRRMQPGPTWRHPAHWVLAASLLIITCLFVWYLWHHLPLASP